MRRIVQVLDEQQSINKKIATQVPVITRKSVQEQPKKPKRKGFLGIFGKKRKLSQRKPLPCFICSIKHNQRTESAKSPLVGTIRQSCSP